MKLSIRTGLLAVVLLLSACGGTNDEPAPQSRTDDAMLEYAQCMRQNGVQVPDPRAGTPGSLYEGVDTASAAFRAADGKCAHILAGVVQEREKQDPGQQQELDAELLALAKCLRENGIQVPDPVPGKADGPFGKSLDRTDPKVGKALQKCQQAAPAPATQG